MILWHIIEVNPLPFMKRYRVYFSKSGSEQWIATFKYQEDALHFIKYPL